MKTTTDTRDIVLKLVSISDEVVETKTYDVAEAGVYTVNVVFGPMKESCTVKYLYVYVNSRKWPDHIISLSKMFVYMQSTVTIQFTLEIPPDDFDYY